MAYRIAVFDYRVTPTNPVGSCHLKMLQELCHHFDFTVFAVEFANPCPERIRWVKIPVPTRPLLLMFVLYHILAPVYYVMCLLRGMRFDIRQTVEGNILFPDITYSQFCHRAYLKSSWQQSKPSGVRRPLRWLHHQLSAAVEPWVYRRARCIVAPAKGLARDLQREYPCVEGKVHLLHNPVDVEDLRRPVDFDQAGFRCPLGLHPDEIVLVFVALGHFERKGLPLLLEALSLLPQPRPKLLVVGGTDTLLGEYRARIQRMGLADTVQFVGMQQDIRPYLWAADAFVLPSYYEAFALVSLQAAAAGLPLIVTPINGVEEFVRDGENGFLVRNTPTAVRQGISRLLELSAAERIAMGQQACRDVRGYSTENFLREWNALYESQALA